MAIYGETFARSDSTLNNSGNESLIGTIKIGAEIPLTILIKK